MGRIQGLTELFVTGDQLLKTGKGYVFSITIAFAGAAAGQKVTLWDNTAASGTVLAVFVLDAANGTINKEWPQGKEFVTGLYHDTQGAGQIQTEITYK